ncbi:hypothetical protein CPB86DRAFT_781977 [Serendipita vermifera]|nr:hypothetical protein CPB86DRAFT_781977 [Serendipita vermifera]
MAPTSYKVLSQEQVDHFLEHGFVVIPRAFTPEQAAEKTANIWARLGYSPDDPETWLSNRVNMPVHSRYRVQEFAPKAWEAMCDLLGGEERVDPETATWSDGFICNFGSKKWDELWDGGKSGINPNDPKKLDNWHVDGDFFVHFLDSKEQGLLIIPLFSDVVPNGGATMVCPDGIGRLAHWLYSHPQGVMPRMRPVDWDESGEEGDFNGLEWYIKTIQECNYFREMTGKMGDVVLMHPLMLHSASRNLLRTHRIIINPPVSLKEPFNYARPDPSEYSLVEQKTLKELAKLLNDPSIEKGLKAPDGTPWKITGERKGIIPARLKIQAKMREMEEARLRGENVEANREGGTINNDPGKNTIPEAQAVMV